MTDIKLRRTPGWKRIGLGLLAVGGALLVIAAACDRSHNEDSWMANEPESCTCQV